MNLSDVYSDQARHFHHTRQKHRPEMDCFCPIVKNLYKNCKVLDLGCGSGRVYPWIQELGRQDIIYTGVDNAQGFTLLAQDLYPQATFVCQDMNSFLSQQEQQSVWCISAIASIQHLNSSQKRQAFFNLSYRSLEYNGYLLLTNRSFSERFLQKYWRQVLFGLRRYAISLGTYQRNDLNIPRKDPQRQENGKIFDRYYHMFTLSELRNHAMRAGFAIEKLCYMGQDGSETMNRRKARNTVLICKKSV